MEPIDTFKREWPEVVKARSSVLSLVGASVVVTFAFASLLYSTTLSGKDSTIESLNTRIGNLESEKVDLEKKLAAIPAKQVDEEKQRRHQELTEKLPGLIGEGAK